MKTTASQSVSRPVGPMTSFYLSYRTLVGTAKLYTYVPSYLSTCLLPTFTYYLHIHTRFGMGKDRQSKQSATTEHVYTPPLKKGTQQVFLSVLSVRSVPTGQAILQASIYQGFFGTRGATFLMASRPRLAASLATSATSLTASLAASTASLASSTTDSVEGPVAAVPPTPGTGISVQCPMIQGRLYSIHGLRRNSSMAASLYTGHFGFEHDAPGRALRKSLSQLHLCSSNVYPSLRWRSMQRSC
mmetsp:Transcript_4669/g.10811  ORF Transcript_4669/g.10811 Transcript_4669/m.10811 type:complete len:244 (-) Transcript_4669:301-1032(-)